MKTNIEVINFIDPDENSTGLGFYVECIDEVGEYTQVGNFHVNQNGVVSGEVDSYLITHNPAFINQATEILKNSGLSYIIGDDLKNEDSLEVEGEYDRIVDDIDFDNIKENSKTADKAQEGKNSKSKSSGTAPNSDKNIIGKSLS